MMKMKAWIFGGAGMLLLVISVMISLSLGSSYIAIGDVWGILWHQMPWLQDAEQYWSKGEIAIVTEVRLSRIALGIMVGACLSLAGAGFQGVLRNPLADPYTLGVASGSSVGAAFIILFGFQWLIGIWTIPLIAFITGMATLIGVIAISKYKGNMQIQTIILAGVIVQSFLGSFVSLMVSLSEGVVNQILYWIMGSLAMNSWKEVALLVPFVLVGAVILVYYGQVLNLLSLGERHASHLGVKVERSKLVVLIVSTLLTAAAVSVSGVIGFVGLIVPHLIRLITGPDYRLIIPLSSIGGAIFMIWSDTIARMVLSPRELPLGVITALIGAPIFTYLLIRKSKESGGVNSL